MAAHKCVMEKLSFDTLKRMQSKRESLRQQQQNKNFKSFANTTNDSFGFCHINNQMKNNNKKK